jgi:hypothetical protein
MPETDAGKKQRWFMAMLWKPYAEINKSADHYETKSAFKSDRAKFIYFLLAMLVISAAIASFWRKSPFDVEDVLWEGGVVVIVCIFVIMGHIWVIALMMLMYLSDKILMMLPPTAAQPVPQIIFGLICWNLGSTAIRVELERRRRSKEAQRPATIEPPSLA